MMIGRSGSCAAKVLTGLRSFLRARVWRDAWCFRSSATPPFTPSRVAVGAPVALRRDVPAFVRACQWQFGDAQNSPTGKGS